MKKILFLTNNLTFSDGVAKALLEICNHLDQEKYDITIRPLYRVDDKFVKLFDSNVKLKPVFKVYFRGLGTILQKLPQRLLYRLFVCNGYDLIVGFQYGVPTKAVGACLNTTAKHVLWMHGYDYGLTLRQSYVNVDKVISVSKSGRDQLIKEMDGKVRCTFCYNLLDDETILEQSKNRIEIDRPDGILLSAVGRLSPEKGYLRLIRIVHKLHKEGVPVSLWIIGNGSERKVLKAEISKQQGDTYIKLLGAQNNPYKFMARSDLFICSSYYEGYSTVCAEAAILGLPIITTAVNGAEEIINDAQCGNVCDNEDEALERAIRAVLLDVSVLEKWKTIALKTGEKFGLAHRKLQLDRLFTELTSH